MDDDSVDIKTKDVQSLLLRSSKARRVQHIFIRFEKSGVGPEFFRRVEEKISWNYKRQENQKYEIALGLSFEGLEALDIPDGYLHIFRSLAPEFSEGAGARAAEHLGDVGASAARYWDDMFAPEHVHAILTIHGSPKSDEQLEAWYKQSEVTQLLEDLSDIQITATLHGQHLDSPMDTDGTLQWHDVEKATVEGLTDEQPPPVWVHFGYRDGLTSNRIRTDSKLTQNSGNNIHEPGELLLGEPRNSGDNPWSLIHRSIRVRSFFSHSSFGVMRCIEQDERGFREHVHAWSEKLKKEWGESRSLTSFVRAKLCGRWPNGQVVRPGDSATTSPSRLIERNNFKYVNHQLTDEQVSPDNDPEGEGCPFSSHIRRMNPRDDVGVQARRRPLFRRGMPYGPWYRKDEKADVQRGLLGLFFCSDLRDQFEHVLGEWADRRPVGVKGDRNQKDPLIGSHSNSHTTLSVTRRVGDPLNGIEISNQTSELNGFTPFVRTRGTVYCFYPSHSAIKELSDPSWLDPEDEPWLTR